jgi:hypothetical protein
MGWDGGAFLKEMTCDGVGQTELTEEGRAEAQAAARVRGRVGMWGLWWTKRKWGRFSPSTSVSPANHHSTNFCIIIITRGWHTRPTGGRSAEWTQLDSTLQYTN